MSVKVGTPVRYVDENGSVYPGLVYELLGDAPHIVYFTSAQWKTTAPITIRDDTNTTKNSWSVV